MDIKTLEALGLDIESLGDRIVDQAVSSLLNGTGFNQDTEEETRYESRFKKEIEARIQKAVDAKIAALAAVHLVPKVGEMIERANLLQTNKYGEQKGPSMTFIEYIASRAEVYMSEDVDFNGNSKAEAKDSYNWKSSGPRLTVLMRLYIKESLEKHAKEAVKDINKTVADAIQRAAKDAISSAAASLKVSITP